MTHPLGRYLKKRSMTHEMFARIAGIGRPTVTKVVTGARRRVSPETARRIVKATKGEVSLEEMLFPRATPPRRAA